MPYVACSKTRPSFGRYSCYIDQKKCGRDVSAFVRMNMDSPISSKSNTIININFSYEPFCRVILVYSNWIEDKLTAALVVNAVPKLPYNDAIRIVRSAHINGSAIVVTVLRQEAAIYADNLLKKGLDCFLEEA
jgi:ATP-dependent Clp protease adapter protein ClpS